MDYGKTKDERAGSLQGGAIENRPLLSVASVASIGSQQSFKDVIESQHGEVDIASALSKIVSRKSLASSALPAIENVKMTKVEADYMRIKDKLRKRDRMHELLRWAQTDYGVDMSKYRNADDQILGKKGKVREIKNEADFIFKVKEKYIVKRNRESAIKI